MKRIISAALCLLLLVVMSTALAGSAGTASNPLISISYLNNTFIPTVKNNGQTSTDSSLRAIYDQAYTKLENTYKSYVQRIAPVSTDRTEQSVPKIISMPSGSSVKLTTGSCITVLSGTVRLSVGSGAVVNVSSGTEISSNAVMPKDARCICAENTSASFTASGDSSVLIDGTYTMSDPVVPSFYFTDVSKGQWFYSPVEFVFNKGYMTGMSSSEFGVSVDTTRAVFVTALYRMAGSPSVSAKSPFSDVKDTSVYYYNAVVWSAANNIINGHDDGTFRPGDSITREQMAAIMYRFAVYYGLDVSVSNSSVFDAFPDNSSVSGYAVDSVKWATAKRLINGMDGMINPGGTAIRAQVAQIIWNFYEFLD